MKKIHKTCLEDLEDSINDYLKKVGTFQWDGDDWTVTNWHMLPKDQTQETYLTCACCQHHPIRELYFVTSEKLEKTEIIGNRCIDKICNQKIAALVQHYKQRINNLEKNMETLRLINDLIEYYNSNPNNTHITSFECTKLKYMGARICIGYNLKKHDIETLSTIHKCTHKFRN